MPITVVTPNRSASCSCATVRVWVCASIRPGRSVAPVPSTTGKLRRRSGTARRKQSACRVLRKNTESRQDRRFLPTPALGAGGHTVSSPAVFPTAFALLADLSRLVALVCRSRAELAAENCSCESSSPAISNGRSDRTAPTTRHGSPSSRCPDWSSGATCSRLYAPRPLCVGTATCLACSGA